MKVTDDDDPGLIVEVVLVPKSALTVLPSLISAPTPKVRVSVPVFWMLHVTVSKFPWITDEIALIVIVAAVAPMAGVAPEQAMIAKPAKIFAPMFLM